MKHMRVKDLIKKLEKCNPEAKIVIHNNYLYNEGLYYVTCIEKYDNCFNNSTEKNTSFVELISNYKTLVGD